MAWITIDHQIKYNGKFYKAGEKFSTEEEDLPNLLKMGAKEVSPGRGRPKGRTREDKTLEWDEP